MIGLLANGFKGWDVISNSHGIFDATKHQWYLTRASRVYGHTRSYTSNDAFESSKPSLGEKRVLWWYKVNLQGEVVYTTLLSMVCEVFYICEKNRCWAPAWFPKQIFTKTKFVITHSVYHCLTVSSWFCKIPRKNRFLGLNHRFVKSRDDGTILEKEECISGS